MRVWFRAVLCTLIAFGAFSVAYSVAYASDSEKKQEFVMHSSQPEGEPVSIWLSQVYKELFKRVAVPLKIVYYPQKRASSDAVYGKIDGQFTRIFQYQSQYPNQIRVNFPLVKIVLIAVANKDSNIQLLNGWRSLEKSDLTVGYLRGIVITEKKIKAITPPHKISAANTLRQGLLKLKYGRTDIFVHSYLTMYLSLVSEEFSEIVPVGVMDAAILFPYVHKRYQHLVPILESTLNDMESEGLIRKYCFDAFGDNAEHLCDGILP